MLIWAEILVLSQHLCNDDITFNFGLTPLLPCHQQSMGNIILHFHHAAQLLREIRV